MTRLRTEPDGTVVVEAASYHLEVAADGLAALLASPRGRPWASLRPLAALDTTSDRDETLAVSPPRVHAERAAIVVERRSTCWEQAAVELVCGDDAIEIESSVRGEGLLDDVHLLGGRSLIPGAPTGFLPSASRFRTLFSPNPGDPARLVRPAFEPAVIGVSGDGNPGRCHWIFTPAPLCFSLTTAEVADPTETLEDGWLGVALAAPVQELTFLQLAYHARDGGFHLALDYEGHTRVDGEFRAPLVILTPGLPDPYSWLRRHREELSARGLAPAVARRDRPNWWLEPMFCGWGAQNHVAATDGGPARDFATQAHYDAFLAALDERGLVPGTIVIDDKWHQDYGTCRPDPAKWPDLRGWIAARHARGQRVLLWWKAWDPEGFPPELCIRREDGSPVALDPTNPRGRDAIAEAVAYMLGPDGLDADGLKIDFTARTPSGRSLSAHGPAWGIALLHELLSVVYVAAKDAKADSLLITHTPHPSFVDVTDMIRLNDMLSIADDGSMPSIAAQMRYRAEIARASCPEVPIDTDDWCIPDRASWREYLEIKPELGVPALYYATHLDRSGEALDEQDYELLRRTWKRWRAERKEALR